jgi:hypothetical protein
MWPLKKLGVRSVISRLLLLLLLLIMDRVRSQASCMEVAANVCSIPTAALGSIAQNSIARR